MLALIAGRGGLPAEVAKSQSTPPLICALEGFEPADVTADMVFRLEHLGATLKRLQDAGVTDICLCGGIARPVIDPSEIEPLTYALIPILSQAISAGDDGALRAVMAIFETAGFKVRAAHDLAPGLLLRAGVQTSCAPDDQMHADALRGDALLAAIAALDVGQACVVGAGQVWGVETVGGTEHMLRNLPEGVREARAILVKAPKTGQDLRADMPAIGPDTVDQLIDAGLVGMALTAGAALVLDRNEVARRADAAGLVIWARD